MVGARSRWRMRWLAVAITCVVTGAWLTAAAGAATPPTRYYMALGGSLATGGGATPGHSDVDDIFSWAKSSIPGLKLENLGCGGDPTTEQIDGGGHCASKYQTGSQLGDAEAFLKAHPGQVAFVTLDIGGDDLLVCAPAIKASCVQQALATLQKNLPVILAGLRAAGGNVPIVGLKYYDPFLADYLKGASGQAAAQQSLSVLVGFNRTLVSAYRQYHVKVANAARAFNSFDSQMTGSYNGQTLPVNVANICNWTHMCQASDPNVHPNDVGHTILAWTFEVRLRGVLGRY